MMDLPQSLGVDYLSASLDSRVYSIGFIQGYTLEWDLDMFLPHTSHHHLRNTTQGIPTRFMKPIGGHRNEKH